MPRATVELGDLEVLVRLLHGDADELPLQKLVFLGRQLRIGAPGDEHQAFVIVEPKLLGQRVSLDDAHRGGESTLDP